MICERIRQSPASKAVFEKIAEDGTSGDAAWTALVGAMNGPVNLQASVCWNAPGTTTVTTVTKDEPDEGEQPVVMTDKQPKQLSYHNWGVALSEVELDTLTGSTSIVGCENLCACMTGEVTILSTKMYYDCGKSLNPAIDIGQVTRNICTASSCVVDHIVLLQ